MNRKKVAAFLSMLGGTAFVFSMLIFMNELSKPPKPKSQDAAKQISLQKQKKKKPPKSAASKPKRKNPRTSTPRAPMPQINTGLSGMSFDLPQFEAGDMMGTDQLLAGRGGGAGLVMTADAVDSLPKPRIRVSPEYPRRAIERGIEGDVLLKIKVTERGDVDNVRVVRAKPPGVFEDAALVAVKQWTFEPGTYRGNPVSVSVDLPMPFQLTR